MKPKPIVFINLPDAGDFKQEDFDRFLSNTKKAMPDYHVIVAMSDVKKIQIKCFYEKDFNQVKYDELKQIIKKSLKK